MKQFTDATGVVMIEIEVYDRQIEWVDIHGWKKGLMYGRLKFPSGRTLNLDHPEDLAALQDLIELKKDYDELLQYCQENHL